MKNKWQKIINECFNNINNETIINIFTRKNIIEKYNNLDSWDDLLELHCLIQGLRNNEKCDKKCINDLNQINRNFYTNKKVYNIAGKTKTNIEESIYYWN